MFLFLFDHDLAQLNLFGRLNISNWWTCFIYVLRHKNSLGLMIIVIVVVCCEEFN